MVDEEENVVHHCLCDILRLQSRGMPSEQSPGQRTRRACDPPGLSSQELTMLARVWQVDEDGMLQSS